jgi:hypothetical protein
MAQFLLVDDRDGSVIAELASPEQAVRLLRRFDATPQGRHPISVVRLEQQGGELSEISSVVAVRTLPWPGQR